jgi:hypothetical protein
MSNNSVYLSHAKLTKKINLCEIVKVIYYFATLFFLINLLFLKKENDI